MYFTSYDVLDEAVRIHQCRKRQNMCLGGVYWCVCVGGGMLICVCKCCVLKDFGDFRKDFLAINHSTLLSCTGVSEF